VEAPFRRLLREFQPEVVHIHHLLGLSPRLPGLARQAGARVVITLHDYWFVCANTWLMRWTRERCPGPGAGYYCGGCALHRIGRSPQALLMGLAAPLFIARTARLRTALRAADVLIAPSRVLAGAYQRQGIGAERMQVIAHGSARLDSNLSGNQAARPPGPLRLVMIGSLIPPKGAHVAIEAFNGLPSGTAELTLYGDTTADPTYVAELRSRARRPGVRLAGPLPRERLAEVLRSVDLLLLPSLWDEPYSMVVDEALAAGLPVLAANLGAPTERLRQGETGLLLPAGDVEAWRQALTRLITEPAELAQLRRRLRATSNGPGQPKSLDEHVSEIEQLYGKLL
jgi:glycosyltransferase involved in cell wall biosynthesis